MVTTPNAHLSLVMLEFQLLLRTVLWLRILSDNIMDIHSMILLQRIAF
ncbi:hypothetical protein VitviT2T_020492 [Vitis vinifera]|uniref:Uncharacterized protein n=1 Tax=Vitis vinifera TaxID=29760 RepID=A0ABY9D3Y6_VITVI|nr:hypothetical protein VitviT2T_020492 [Vitis vinifera]